MTSQNDLSPSAANETAAVAQSNVIDMAAFAARRRAPAPAVDMAADAVAAECEGVLASAPRTDTEMLIQAMRALAVARARLDRLSREAAECRRKLEAIKLG